MIIRMKWDYSNKGKESQIFETIHGPLFVRTNMGAKYFSLIQADRDKVFGESLDSWPCKVSECTIDYIKYVLGEIIIKSAKGKK